MQTKQNQNRRASFLQSLIDACKICKYEFKHSRLLFITVMLLTVCNGIFMALEYFNGYALDFAVDIFISIFTIACMFVFLIFGIVFIISAVSSFYRGMFGQYAYLTHSLPVSVDSLLLSKIFVFLLWCVIGLLELIWFISTFTILFDGFSAQLELVLPEDGVVYFLSSLLMCATELTYIFMIIALVHHKKARAAFFGTLLYFGIKFLFAIIFLVFIFFITESVALVIVENLSVIEFCAFGFSSIVCYSICRFVVKNRLSL